MKVYIRKIERLGYLVRKADIKSYILEKYHICEYVKVYVLKDCSNNIIYSSNDADDVYSYINRNGYTFVKVG